MSKQELNQLCQNINKSNKNTPLNSRQDQLVSIIVNHHKIIKNWRLYIRAWHTMGLDI